MVDWEAAAIGHRVRRLRLREVPVVEPCLRRRRVVSLVVVSGVVVVVVVVVAVHAAYKRIRMSRTYSSASLNSVLVRTMAW